MDVSINSTEIATTVSALTTMAKSLVGGIQAARALLPGKNKAATAQALAVAEEAAESLRAGQISLQTTVLQVQKELLALQAENGQLRGENTKLREQISQKEERALERAKYRREVKNGTTVMVREDEPGTYYCATCYAKGSMVPLQPTPFSLRAYGTHKCGICGDFLTLL